MYLNVLCTPLAHPGSIFQSTGRISSLTFHQGLENKKIPLFYQLIPRTWTEKYRSMPAVNDSIKRKWNRVCIISLCLLLEWQLLRKVISQVHYQLYRTTLTWTQWLSLRKWDDSLNKHLFSFRLLASHLPLILHRHSYWQCGLHPFWD